MFFKKESAVAEIDTLASKLKAASEPRLKHRAKIVVLPGETASERIFALTRKTGGNGENKIVSPIYGKDNVEFWMSSKRFTLETIAAIASLMGLNCIVCIVPNYFELKIQIGQAFDWEDIQPEVLSLIRNAFYDGDEFEAVVVDDRTKTAV